MTSGALRYLLELDRPGSKSASGTDFPFPLGETEPGSLIRDAKFDEDTTSKLVTNNALSWLDRQNLFDV